MLLTVIETYSTVEWRVNRKQEDALTAVKIRRSKEIMPEVNRNTDDYTNLYECPVEEIMNPRDTSKDITNVSGAEVAIFLVHPTPPILLSSCTRTIPIK
jgi:hypothetical protein